MPFKRPRPDTPRPSRFSFTTDISGGGRSSANFMDDWFGPCMNQSQHERGAYRGFWAAFSGDGACPEGEEDYDHRAKKRRVESSPCSPRTTNILNLNPVAPTRKDQRRSPRSTRTPALRVHDPLESNLTGFSLGLGLAGSTGIHPGRELGADAVYTTARSMPVQVPLPVTHATDNRDVAEDAYASVFVQARGGDMENNLHASPREYVVKVKESNLFNAFDDLFQQYDTSIDEMQQQQQQEIFGAELEREPAMSNADIDLAVVVEDMLTQARQKREDSLHMTPPAVPIPRRTGLMYAPPVGEVRVGDVHADPDRVGADGNAAPVTPTDVDIDNDVESQSESDDEMEIDDDSSVSSDSDYHGVREESSDEEFEDPDTSLTVPEEEEEEEEEELEVKNWAAKRPPTPFPKVPVGDDGLQEKRDSESETASSDEGQSDPETIDWDAYIPQSPILIEEIEEEGYDEDDEEDAEEELHDPKRPWAAKCPPSPCLVDDSDDEDDEDEGLQRPLAGKRVPGQYPDEESSVQKRGQNPRRPWGAKRVPGHYPGEDADDEEEEEEEEQATRRPRAGKRIPAQYRNEGEEKDPRRPWGAKRVPGWYQAQASVEEDENKEEEVNEPKRPWATKTVAPLLSVIDEFELESGYDGDEEGTGNGPQATDLASGVNVELLELMSSMNAKIAVLEDKVRSLEDKVRGLRRK